VGQFRSLACSFLVALIAACSLQASPAKIPAKPAPTNTSAAILQTSQPAITQSPPEVPTVAATLACEQWQSWPVIPSVPARLREIYQRGLLDGNNPHAFSRIGDGEIAAEWFLTAFDLGKDDYDLGPYQELVPVIEHFSSSFGRIGVAAHSGFNTERILDPSWRERQLCAGDESPLTCELRLQRPAFVILSLGTNQVWQPEQFERGLREILAILLAKNIVPILSTKGDNLEGDQRINHTIACLAEEYQIPLWNFWAAIQPLPHHGLQPDLEHLTYGITDFDDEHAMQSAWTVRNLTALQALDAVWRGASVQP
jgi:hypothetical protein